jgi:uncharacterized protein YgbK (DUF1537 family)
VLLGCVADDLTGATDLGGVLVGAGLQTDLVIGVPDRDTPSPDLADAVVVALASRHGPAECAVRDSLASARWLLDHGAERLFFKYCSTFDSTDDGNIGPVADALCDLVDAGFAIVCPSYPANGRAVRGGLLYVHGVPLSDTGMRDHPLTPMTDSDLVSVLGRQTRSRVGLVPLATVREGPDAVAARGRELEAAAVRYGVCDAETDADLAAIATAIAGCRLATGGSATAAAWATALFAQPEHLSAPQRPQALRLRELGDFRGRGAVLAGSCSEATRRQVRRFASHHPAVIIDPETIAAGADPVAELRALFSSHDGPVLVASRASPEDVARAQASLGRARAAAIVEDAIARCAVALHDAGTRRFIVAGGETAGAVVNALGVRALRVGADLDPGVPRCVSVGDDPIELVLKSGNFGGDDLFERALQ